MIRPHWLWVAPDDLRTELLQLEDEGRDVSKVRPRLQALIEMGGEALALPENQTKAAALLDACQALRTVRGYGFEEPSGLEEIKALRPEGIRKFQKPLPDARMRKHLHGAWLGRCIGCYLGKPVEGARTGGLWPFLKDSRQWPISRYLNFKKPEELLNKHPRAKDIARRWKDPQFMPVDDDTNYTVTGLLILKEKGGAFTPSDVARFWMSNIPLLSTCTAERVAYRNFALSMSPPASASFRNPYREWIGAQIRADAFGYVNAGNPERAAEFAWRDACISHVKNGIYGEMAVAAMIAAAPYCQDAKECLEIGLAQVPKASRLQRDIRSVLSWREEGCSYDEAVARIHKQWDENLSHHWCHTLSNAMICAVALLWGEGDFGRSICMAVQPMFDTDCNGATVGSIVGMMKGVDAIPETWSKRLNDTLHTSLNDHNVVRISDMAQRSFEVYKSLLA